MIKYWIHGGGGKYYESGIQYSCLSLFRGEREKKKGAHTRVHRPSSLEPDSCGIRAIVWLVITRIHNFQNYWCDGSRVPIFCLPISILSFN